MGQAHEPCTTHCWHQIPYSVTAAAPLFPGIVCCFCGERSTTMQAPQRPMFHGPHAPNYNIE
jgi:hypothetical protein